MANCVNCGIILCDDTASDKSDDLCWYCSFYANNPQKHKLLPLNQLKKKGFVR